eukprot:9888314-Alexandrium_andersonii.AAC.1
MSESGCSGVARPRGSLRRGSEVRVDGVAFENPRVKAVGGRVMGIEPLSDPQALVAVRAAGGAPDALENG